MSDNSGISLDPTKSREAAETHNWLVIEEMFAKQKVLEAEVKVITTKINEDSGLGALISSLTETINDLKNTVKDLGEKIEALDGRITALEESNQQTISGGEPISLESIGDYVETPHGTKYMIDRFGSHIFADSFGIDKLKYICWDVEQTELPFPEGMMAWEEANGTLNLGMPGGNVIQQIGEELYLAGRPQNVQGVQVNNGQAVYLYDSVGKIPQVKLANASNVTAVMTIAIATQNVPNNQRGFYTVNGVVRYMDTSFGSDGDEVFLDTVDGSLTVTPPSHPNYRVRIGFIEYSHATEGMLNVNIIACAWLKAMQSSKSPQGFDYAIPDSRGDITWTEGTRTFEIDVVGGEDYFSYWHNAEEYRQDTPQSVVIPDTTGLHFVQFNGDTISTSMTPWTFGEDVFVAIIYWNSTLSKGIPMEERHLNSMPRSDHYYLHKTVNTRYESGLTGTFNDIGTFTITAGVYHDEDIPHSISQQTTCRIFYRDASLDWEFTSPGSSYFYEDTSVIQYDNSGVLTDVPNANFVSYYIYATNETIPNYVNPIWSIMGQRVDTTLNNALSNQTPDTLALGYLPSPEMLLIYQVIVKRTGTSETKEQTIDYRRVSTVPGQDFTATSHLALSDKNAGDGVGNHTHAANLQGRPGGQTLPGGTATTETLTLQDNAVDLNSIEIGSSVDFNELALDNVGDITHDDSSVSDLTIKNADLDKNIKFNVNDGTVPTDALIIQGSTSAVEALQLTINSSTPVGLLRLVEEGTNTTFVADNYSNTATRRNAFNFRRANGTESSPSAASSGAQIFNINANAYDGSDFFQVGRISAIVDTVTGTGDASMYWSIRTRNDGSSETEKMQIAKDGGIFFNALLGSTGGSDARYDTGTGELFYDTSSARYKNGIVPLEKENADKILLFRVKKYQQNNMPEVGFIAEEMEVDGPEFVCYALRDREGNKILGRFVNVKDYVGIEPNIWVEANLLDEEGRSHMIEIIKTPESVNLTGMIPLLIKIIQDQEGRIKALEQLK
jgi:hypothetical protein